MKTLKDVKVGETATVIRLHGEGPVKRRIMDMGITKGVEIFVRKIAVHHKPQFRQVLARFIFAGDFADHNSFSNLCYCQRHHFFPPPPKS